MKRVLGKFVQADLVWESDYTRGVSLVAGGVPDDWVHQTVVGAEVRPVPPDRSRAGLVPLQGGLPTPATLTSH